jgi:hypothetical protein
MYPFRGERRWFKMLGKLGGQAPKKFWSCDFLLRA